MTVVRESCRFPALVGVSQGAISAWQERRTAVHGTSASLWRRERRAQCFLFFCAGVSTKWLISQTLCEKIENLRVLILTLLQQVFIINRMGTIKRSACVVQNQRSTGASPSGGGKS